jgi:nucleotide-binding universal stress UspA family protein
VDANLGMVASIEGVRAIVVGSHRRSDLARLWHGSVSAGVVHRADTNVFVIPRGTDEASDTPAVEYRTLLVPTDFSSLSRRAIAHAMRLLRPGGTLRLLHVLAPEAGDSAARLAELQALAPAAAAQHGLQVVAEVVSAHDVARAILQAAARVGADVICMSTHGVTGLAGTLMGSEAQAVLRNARLPVLLVPPPRDG